MPRIAVVHEWLTRWAGSEAVVEQILRLWPTADLYVLAGSGDGETKKRLAGRKVHYGFVQRLPFGGRKPNLYLPLLPWAAEQLDLRSYDLVISSSHCVAKGVIAGPDAVHVAYVHTPMRYAWDLQQSYADRIPWPLRPIWAWQMHKLRQWDTASGARPDAIASNSAYIANRIRRAWRRESTVIFPPVDTTAFTPGGERGPRFLTASRLVGYKRIPDIVAAFAGMPELPLTVIGDGADMGVIRRIASRHPNIEILGHVDRATLIEHMRTARAFVFAAEEDFGIAPVEAMACGTPVIAFGRGGAAESVIDGTTGLLFPSQDPASIQAAIRTFCSRPAPASSDCTARASHFSEAAFRTRFGDFVRSACAGRGWEL